MERRERKSKKKRRRKCVMALLRAHPKVIRERERMDWR